MSFTSTSTGSNTVNSLLKQTIYLKETEAPDGYQLSTDIYCLKMTNTQYQVIRYSSAGKVIQDSGQVNFAYESGIRTVQITATNVEDNEKPAKLKVRKISANTALTENNALYSLTGAEYGVYASENDAENGKNCLTTLVTEDDGTTPAYTVTYPQGSQISETWSQKFYVKELKAPEGYLKCEEIHEVTAYYGKTATVECTETPAAQNLKLSVYKKNAETGELVDLSGDAEAANERAVGEDSITGNAAAVSEDSIAGNAAAVSEDPIAGDAAAVSEDSAAGNAAAVSEDSAAGNADDAYGSESADGNEAESVRAVFLMQYWDNTTGDHSGDPVKTWYFTTNEKGVLDFAEKSNLLANYTFGSDSTADGYDGQTVTSDSLYTDADGSIIYPVGTYWVRELAAPEGYKLSGYMTVEGDTTNTQESLDQGITTVITLDSIENGEAVLNYQVGNVSVRADSGSVIDAFDEPLPQPGTLTLQKVSADPDRTDGNDSYSLAGAVYGVYRSLDEDREDDSIMAELTTDQTGATEKLELDATQDGITYYVKELTASRGYQLCDGSDGAEDKDAEGTGIHKVTVKSGENVTVTCKETPKVASLNMKMVKKDASAMAEEMTDDSEAQESGDGAGAIFALKYWKNGDGDESGDPDSVWYFRTDNTGSIDFTDESCLVTKYTFSKNQSQNAEYAGKTIRSAALEKDSDGKVIWSLGTYQLLEICLPALYQLDGVMMFADDVVDNARPVTDGIQLIISTDAGTGEVTYVGSDTPLNAASIIVKAFDHVHFSVLNVTKYGKDKETLAGVSYQLIRTADGKKYDLVTTDQNGKAAWENLIPGQYILTETATVDGYDLLAENITIDLPCQMTEAEVREQNADISQTYFDEVNQTYCFEQVNYQITDSVEFEVPMTGGSDWAMAPVSLLAMLLVGVGLLWIDRRMYER